MFVDAIHRVWPIPFLPVHFLAFSAHDEIANSCRGHKVLIRKVVSRTFNPNKSPDKV